MKLNFVFDGDNDDYYYYCYLYSLNIPITFVVLVWKINDDDIVVVDDYGIDDNYIDLLANIVVECAALNYLIRYLNYSIDVKYKKQKNVYFIAY